MTFTLAGRCRRRCKSGMRLILRIMFSASHPERLLSFLPISSSFVLFFISLSSFSFIKTFLEYAGANLARVQGRTVWDGNPAAVCIGYR